jgi:hypothetical protein
MTGSSRTDTDEPVYHRNKHEAGEVHLLHAAERDGARSALHVGRALGDRIQTGLRRDRHPLDFQSLNIETAFQ